MTSAIDSAPPATARPERPSLGAVRRTVREVGLALITAGVVVLLFVGYQLFGTNITESHNQHALARQFSSEVGHPPAATGGADTPTVGSQQSQPAQQSLPSVPAGGAVDHLVIPRIGLDKYVVEGTNEQDLRRGPGHYTGTAYPGQLGNAAIAGHRTTYGAPFFRLGEMAPGDPIYITDLTGHTWVYKVSARPEVVSPDDVAVLDPTPFAQLTLTTCNPKFSASSRLIVFARLVGAAQPAVKATQPAPVTPRPAPVAAPVISAGALGHGESGAWTPTLLYGGLTLVLWVATRVWVHRTRRWHRAAALVIGVAICLVPLWFCFENAVLLLPQSI